MKQWSKLKPHHYKCITADPPWPFANQATRASTHNHYKDMTPEDIISLPVSVVASPQAHLYLWTTDGHLPLALEVMRKWDFIYKQTLVWVKGEPPPGKIRIGMGNWFRHAHELVLFGVRAKFRATVHNLPSVFYAPRQGHSRKPTKLLEMAEAMTPGPRLELFARPPHTRGGWTVWGDQS